MKVDAVQATAETLLLALLMDAVVGDPPWLYRRVPHPVVLIGRAVEAGERSLNDARLTPRRRLLAGLGLTVAVVVSAVLAGTLVETAFAALPGGSLALALAASTLLAARGLHDHAAAVLHALPTGLVGARRAVSHLVGRDPERLDLAGVVRAAIESLAENFSDALVAPVCWYLVGGLPGLLGYKAVNTLDSTLGHRGERLEWFGKVPARLDDAANWVPARVAGALICTAACLVPGARGMSAWRTMWRDAGRHRSVNAGWQEAAMAGALGVALAGPRRYASHAVEDAWMGDGTPEAGAGDLHRALRLYLSAAALTAGAVAALALSGAG